MNNHYTMSKMNAQFNSVKKHQLELEFFMNYMDTKMNALKVEEERIQNDIIQLEIDGPQAVTMQQVDKVFTRIVKLNRSEKEICGHIKDFVNDN